MSSKLIKGNLAKVAQCMVAYFEGGTKSQYLENVLPDAVLPIKHITSGNESGVIFVVQSNRSLTLLVVLTVNYHFSAFGHEINEH